MSFQRSLTGESSIYANVILNTNISADSVSCNYLSATNASITNLTANTFTYGNISTPNVIATNGYFSNLYTSTFNANNLNLSTATITNLSTSNISNTSAITTSILTGYIVNTSFENSCLVNTSTIYSNYAYMSNLYVSNTSSKNSQTQYLKIQDNEPSIDFNFSNAFINNNYGTIGYYNGVSSLVMYSTSQNVPWLLGGNGNSSYSMKITKNYEVFTPSYSSVYMSNLSVSNLSVSTITSPTINTSTLTAINVSSVSVSSISLNTSTLTAYTVNTSFENSCLVNTSTLYANYEYVSNLYVSTLSASSFILPATISVSNLCASNVYTQNIYGVSYISSQDPLSIRNSGVIIRDKNTSGTAYLALNYDSSSFGGETYGMILEADQTSGAVLTAGYQMPLTITLDGVSQLYNTCAGGFRFYNTINNSFTTNLSRLNNTSLYASNISVSNLSIANALYVSNISVSNFSGINMSISGKIDVSNISATAISATGQISASTIRGSFNIISAGNLSGVDIYGSGVNCSNVFVSVQVNTSQVSCRSISSASTYTSWISASNASITNASLTTATGTTINSTTFNGSTVNASTLAVSTFSPASIVTTNLSATNASFQSLNVYSGANHAGSITKFGSNELALSTELAGTSMMTFYIASNLKGKISTSQVLFLNPLYVSTGNFSNLNASNFNPANITTTTLSASTLNASNLNVSNFNPASLTTATVNASTGNICNISAITITSVSVYASQIYVSGATTQTRVLSTGIEAPSLNVSVDGNINYLTAVNGTVQQEFIIQDQLTFRTGTGAGTLEADVMRNSSYITFRNYPSLCNGFAFADNVGNKYASFNGSDHLVMMEKLYAPNASLSNISGDNMSISNAIDTTYLTAYSVYADQLSTGGTFGATNVQVKGGQYSLMDSFYHNYMNIGFNAYTSTVNFQTNAGYGDNINFQIGSSIPLQITNDAVSVNTSLYASYLSVSSISTSTLTNVSATLDRINNTSLFTTNISVSSISTSTLTNVSATLDRINNTSLYTTNISVSSISTSTLTNVSATLNRINNTSLFTTNISVASLSTSNITTTGRITTSNLTVINSSTTNASASALSTSSLNATNISTTSISGNTSIITINCSQINSCALLNISNITVENISLTSISGNTSIITINCSQINTCAKINTSSVSAINISTENFSVNNEMDVLFLNCTGTIHTDYLVSIAGLDCNFILNTCWLNTSYINNSIGISNPTLPLSIYSTSNTCDTGLRIPSYLDTANLGGLTIGANQTTGFINVCRGLRCYSNILTDNNINTLTTGGSIGVGGNITTGDLKLGNTAMSGNISVDTTGSMVFGCDRRSTYNTSNLVKCSTQLGSFYSFTTGTNSFTKTSTGQTLSYHPFTNNISLTIFPVGLYLVTGNGYIQAQGNVSGNFNGVVTSVVSGIAIGTSQPSGNTARIQYFNCGALPELTNTSGIVKPISWSGVYNLTNTSQYITMYVGVTCASAVTAGNILGVLGAISVTKIA